MTPQRRSQRSYREQRQTQQAGVAFQVYLIEGLARWNLQWSQDSKEGADEESATKLRYLTEASFKCFVLCVVHNKLALSSFCTPPAYTGEIIGMSYLRSQTGDCAGEVQELDKEIYKAFGDFNMANDAEEEDMLETDDTDRQQ